MHKLHLTGGGWIQRFLLSQPENGIGFQLVELYLKDGKVIPELKAWNAEVIELPKQYKDITEEKIVRIAAYHGFKSAN